VTAGQISLIVSGCALAISICGFLWSIWKEFIFVKPRVQVSFAVMSVRGGTGAVKDLLVLTATNMGPGPVSLYLLLGPRAPELAPPCRLRLAEPDRG
jgi:hypothetical protein